MQMLDLMLYASIGVIVAVFFGILFLLGWAIHKAVESYEQAEREKQA